MNSFRPFVLLCGGVVACALTSAPLAAREKFDLERLAPVPADQPVPTMDFFRPRLLQSPSLNRGGTHMAALITNAKDRHDLLIYDLEKKEFKTVFGTENKEIYSFRWLDDTRLLYLVSTDKLYAFAMMVVNINRLRDSYPLLQYRGARLVGIPERNRLRPLVWMSFDALHEGRDMGVAEVRADVTAGRLHDLSSGQALLDSDIFEQVDENNQRHVAKTYPIAPGGIGNGYVADKQGELAFAFTGDKQAFLTLHEFVDGKWAKTPVDLETVDFVTAGDQPGEIVVLAPRTGVGDKPRPLQRMKAATGELGEVLLQDKRYEFDGTVFRDEMTRDIVGVSFDRAGPEAVWFDESYRAAQKMIDASFPKQVVRIIDGDKNGRLLIATSSDRQPSVYHWVNLTKREAGLIKNSAPWIDPARMRPMGVITFKTRDGHQLDAYLTMPAGATKANPPPLVVLPHGGPWVRDTWGFDGEVQFLASRGYAVLQPNYRGSSGYDWMFPEEDRYEFRKMHDDVTEATKAVLASGYADPSRVAIMGGSFGAYLALSGVGHEPELYRCAVTIAGVFDWETVLKARKYDQYSSSSYAYLKRKLGDPRTQQEKYDAISPLRHVGRVRVPVFVSHGKEDSIAEVGESRRLIAELKQHNVPHEVLLVSGEGHGMSHLENQVELYDRVSAFLAANLARRSAPAASGAAGSP